MRESQKHKIGFEGYITKSPMLLLIWCKILVTKNVMPFERNLKENYLH